MAMGKTGSLLGNVNQERNITFRSVVVVPIDSSGLRETKGAFVVLLSSENPNE